MAHPLRAWIATLYLVELLCAGGRRVAGGEGVGLQEHLDVRVELSSGAASVGGRRVSRDKPTSGSLCLFPNAADRKCLVSPVEFRN